MIVKETQELRNVFPQERWGELIRNGQEQGDGKPGVGGMGASLDSSVQEIRQGFSYSIMVLDNKQIGAERIPLVLGGKKNPNIFIKWLPGTGL